jgi:hypothetical protein
VAARAGSEERIVSHNGVGRTGLLACRDGPAAREIS